MRALLLITAGTATALAASLAGAPATGAPTASGVDGSAADSYFPNQGNRGYDAQAYRIKVDYQPGSDQLSGRVRVVARATKDLSRFSLDLRPWLRAHAVTVDGHAAVFRQPAKLEQKLVIVPRPALAKGERFTAVIRYRGTVEPVIDPDGSQDGWSPTADGAFVASEPQGSPSWFPVNDTPNDKARFAVSVTVPHGRTAFGPGELVSVRRTASTATWSWAMRQPISSYLVTATNGRFAVRRGTTPGGIPWVTGVTASQQRASATVLRRLPRIVDYFTGVFGPYPFDSVGAIVDDAPQVGYALETATKPVFDSAPDVETLAHEIAHQWYGDSVTLRRWRDIWLNEGFAEWATWLWVEHSGGATAAEQLDKLLAQPADAEVWNPPPANPGGPADLFSDSVYVRGAGAMQALRERIGDPAFFRILRGWAAKRAYGNATVPQFTRYAERISGTDLDGFFHRWLYREGKPLR